MTIDAKEAVRLVYPIAFCFSVSNSESDRHEILLTDGGSMALATSYTSTADAWERAYRAILRDGRDHTVKAHGVTITGPLDKVAALLQDVDKGEVL